MTAASNAAPLNTAALLDFCCAWVRKYVVLNNDQINVLAAWILHTWAIEAAEFTPYLHITAPEKGCGKTRLLEVLEAVVCNPCKTGGISAAALLRTVDAERPTILLDEVDAAFGGDKEFSEALRGILNDGFRRGGNYRKCVGKGHELRVFQVFGPKALAGIGKIPDTVSSRSIVIEMRRRSKAENAERFRLREVREAAAPLRDNLRAWAESGAIPVLEAARPSLPDELGDRQQDISEPLLAIADLAAGEWPSRLRCSLLALFSSVVSEDSSLGVKLLRDVRNIFSTRCGKEFERIHSADLAHALCEIEGAPWFEWDRGRGLTANSLAKRLKAFQIAPQSIRIGSENKKGYLRDAFLDLWGRYLPAETVTAVTDRANTCDSPPSVDVTHDAVTYSPFHSNPHKQRGVTAVTAVETIAEKGSSQRYIEGSV